MDTSGSSHIFYISAGFIPSDDKRKEEERSEMEKKYKTSQYLIGTAAASTSYCQVKSTVAEDQHQGQLLNITPWTEQRTLYNCN